MASYQNTFEYYRGTTMDTYPGNRSHPIIYNNQNPEFYQNHGVKPVSSYQISYQEPRPYSSNSCMAKRHRAQILILPSSHGSYKATIKRKRKRTMFTSEQVKALEDIFENKKYISREERQVVVQNFQLQDKAVKLWFQNRRLKAKRLQNQDSEEQKDYSSETSAILDTVESEIRKKTDDKGFVTLDDGIMEDLTNLIQNCLRNNSVDVSGEALFYEAISPARASDIDPSASFQRSI